MDVKMKKTNQVSEFIFGCLISSAILAAGYMSSEMWKSKNIPSSTPVAQPDNTLVMERIDFLFEEVSALKALVDAKQLPNFSTRLDVLETEIARMKDAQTGVVSVNPDLDKYILQNAQYINSVLRAAQIADDQRSYLNIKKMSKIASTYSEGKPLYIYRYNCGECYDNYLKFPNADIRYFPMGDNIQIGAVLYALESFLRGSKEKELDAIKKAIFTKRIEKLDDVYAVIEKNGVLVKTFQDVLYNETLMRQYTDMHNAFLNAGVRNKPVLIMGERYKEGIMTNVDIGEIIPR